MDRDIIRQNREALKKYFKKGCVPTEEQFAELIDSMANIAEDGQVEQTATGWAFYPAKAGRLDISLFTEKPKDSGTKAAWTITITEDKRLVISNGNKEAAIEISQDKTVTTHGDDEPKPANGDGYFTIPADKKWHDMPVDFSREDSNCRVFGIYASYNDDMDYCRLTRATAVWMNKMEQRVESPQKHWWGWSGCVRIRWDGYSKLQIRTKKRSGGEVRCRIVEVYKA
jgi:hypothetical protein